ncbi:MEMO1 family protein [Candidatus Micrarchaeota archaeon]|nr:MEMO1 family protein [Candidatus Micrarchaeota archaeon]
MRYPAVEGAFYPSGEEQLKKEVERAFSKGAGLPELGDKKNLIAVVSPHAGYVYSGWVASYAYREIAENYSQPPTFVILGPNHTGKGSGVALSREDWETPLGVASNDRELGKLIQKNSRIVDFDELAHQSEHSVEVQLPFLQFIYKDFKFVPICLGLGDYETADGIAHAILKASQEMKRDIFVIASSDFTHFEDAQSAKKKDELALEAIKRLDAKLFLNEVENNNISICGYAPIMVAIIYSKLKGGKEAKVLKYANSGDVTKDYHEVVAYCSVAFPK